MKAVVTPVVLLLVALALAFYLVRNQGSVTESERHRREHNVFVAWRREDVSRIEMRRGDDAIVLVRDVSGEGRPGWSTVGANPGPTDAGAVDRLVGALEFATRLRWASEARGLEAPSLAGSLTMGNTTIAFRVGAEAPQPAGARYFQIDGEKTMVVSKELTDALGQPFDGYRDKTVLATPSNEINELTIEHGDARLSLRRRSPETFVLGTSRLATRTEVTGLFAALADLQAEAFLGEAQASLLTSHVRTRMHIASKRGPWEIVFGDPCPGQPESVSARRLTPSRLDVCVAHGLVDRLERDPEALVERAPFSFWFDEVEELRLEAEHPTAQGLRVLDLARTGKSWRLREPISQSRQSRDLDPEEAAAVDGLVARITHLEATDVLPAAPVGWTPVGSVRVGFQGRTQTIRVGMAGGMAGGTAALERLADGAWLGATASDVRMLTLRDTIVRSRTLFGEAHRATSVRLRCGAAQDFEDRGQGLRLVKPTGYETDSRIVELATAILRGKVDFWVADAPSPEFGFDRSSCRIELGLDDGTSRAVRFGATIGGDTYGQIEGSPHVFAISHVLAELAGRYHISRVSLRLAPEAIRSARVVRGISWDDARLRSWLSTWVAERVVRLGPPSFVEAFAVDVTTDTGKRRVTCAAPAADGSRLCAASDVNAVFEFFPSAFAVAPNTPNTPNNTPEVLAPGGADQ